MNILFSKALQKCNLNNLVLKGSFQSLKFIAANDSLLKFQRNSFSGTKSLYNVCYNCGERGHVMTKCTAPKNLDKDQYVKCYKCGKQGHLSMNCSIVTAADVKVCHNCLEKGHTTKNCSRPVIITCFNCGNTGHTLSNCPTKVTKVKM
jgi:hypothetical protein